MNDLDKKMAMILEDICKTIHGKKKKVVKEFYTTGNIINDDNKNKGN